MYLLLLITILLKCLATQQSQVTSNTNFAEFKPIFTKSPQAVHPYAFANSGRTREFYDNIHNIQLRRGGLDRYMVLEELGRGNTSRVHRAIDTETEKEVALKFVFNSLPKPTIKEIKITQELNDAPNNIKLLDIFEDQDDDKNIIVIVLEYFKPQKFKAVQQNLSKYQLKFFMYEFLKSLDYVHSQGIIHRDLKPDNVLFNAETLQAKVIDFGQSTFYRPGYPLETKRGTLNYKPPDVLFNNRFHDYSFDIWSLGCIFGEMMFGKILFQSDRPTYRQLGLKFSIRDEAFWTFLDTNHLDAIAKIMGTKRLREYAEKNKEIFSMDYFDKIDEHEGIEFWEMIDETNHHLVDGLAIDLLKNMLEIDHTKRITAKEALEHPFFDDTYPFRQSE